MGKFLYVDNRVVVFNKPAGLCTDAHPEHGHVESAQQQIMKSFPSFVCLHRIDMETSGILLSGSRMSTIEGVPANMWIQRHWHTCVSKTYLAVIKTPNWSENSCDLSLQDKPGDPLKTCKTGFRILESVNGYSLVECRLIENGRKHQIRKHLKHLGSPIVGDRVYGGAPTRVRKGQLLHAWKLKIKFPDGEQEFQAPIPADFKAFFGENWKQIEGVVYTQ